MCHPISALRAFQQAIPNGCSAKSLPPSQRQQIALQGLAGTQTITTLANEFDTSRKFVYEQVAIADQALEDAFAPSAADQDVLFHLPVTKQWLRQLTLGLVLICHSPLRGVVELLGDLFDYHISLGSVFNTVQAAVAPARQCNQAQDLSGVRAGAHDEIFQAGQPVLVGVDPWSTYCYLLSLEESRDSDTWGVRLLELQERGFAPQYVVADAAQALRAALAEVMSETGFRGDVFHAEQELYQAVTILENRAYKAMTRCLQLELKIARDQHLGRPLNRSYVKQRNDANKKQAQAIQLADDLALLARWLGDDILGLAGPAHADRLALYDFVLSELQQRVPQAHKLLYPVVRYLRRQRDNLLVFAAELDRQLSDLAAQFAVTPSVVRQLFALQTLALDNPKRWHGEAPLQRILGDRYFPLSRALQQLRRDTVRASSVVENLNSRLRSYFFLRRHLGNDYLALLQFFLNHRCFLRSEHPERSGKSPAELLTGQSHPHWLELLGYTRFSRN